MVVKESLDAEQVIVIVIHNFLSEEYSISLRLAIENHSDKC